MFLYLVTKEIKRLYGINGFSSLFTEKKIFFLSEMSNLRIEKKEFYFADRPTDTDTPVHQ